MISEHNNKKRGSPIHLLYAKTRLYPNIEINSEQTNPQQTNNAEAYAKPCYMKYLRWPWRRRVLCCTVTRGDNTGGVKADKTTPLSRSPLLKSIQELTTLHPYSVRSLRVQYLHTPNALVQQYHHRSHRQSVSHITSLLSEQTSQNHDTTYLVPLPGVDHDYRYSVDRPHKQERACCLRKRTHASPPLLAELVFLGIIHNLAIIDAD